MRKLRIGLVTCRPEKLWDYFPTQAEPELLPAEPPFTPDDQLLVDELRRRGHIVQPVIWGGDVALLRSQFDTLVVRSPWDYMDSEASRLTFFDWIAALDQAGIPVWNPPAVMTWLTDKRYLLDLERAGAPIVPTLYTGPGEGMVLADHFHGPLVIKPAISAAGVGLLSIESLDEAMAFQERFTRLNGAQGYLIQPLLSEIRTKGEWSLVYFGGIYSHTIHKIPAPGNILCHAERGGSLRFTDAPASVRAAADRAVRNMPIAWSLQFAQQTHHHPPFPLLYLRMDVIETCAGPLISECEGVEPELFFRARPGSENLFVELLEARLSPACQPH